VQPPYPQAVQLEGPCNQSGFRCIAPIEGSIAYPRGKMPPAEDIFRDR